MAKLNRLAATTALYSLVFALGVTLGYILAFAAWYALQTTTQLIASL